MRHEFSYNVTEKKKILKRVFRLTKPVGKEMVIKLVRRRCYRLISYPRFH
jgi:ubiquinone/menaquinone biosynthesis C-methylase UbiE